MNILSRKIFGLRFPFVNVDKNCAKFRLINFNKKQIHHVNNFKHGYSKEHVCYSKYGLLLSFTIPFWNFQKQSKKEELIEMIQKGMDEIDHANYDHAEMLLHLALKYAQEIGNNDGINYIYSILGALACDRGQFSKAEPIYVMLINNMTKKGMAEDSTAMISMNLKFANARFMNNKEGAEDMFQSCFKNINKRIERGDNDEDTLTLLGMFHEQYASFLISRRNFSEAKSNLKESLEICKQLKGENDPQVAVILNTIGNLCLLEGKKEDSIDNILKAIIAAEKGHADNLFVYYTNLGQVYFLVKNYERALSMCREGLKLADKAKSAIGVEEAKTCIKAINDKRN